MSSNAASPATAPVPPAPAAPGASQPARVALLLLVLINLFNYIDRQVLAAVEPEIRKTFFPGRLDQATGLTVEPEDAKFWMRLLSTAFLVTYMLTAPLFGWLANRM